MRRTAVVFLFAAGLLFGCKPPAVRTVHELPTTTTAEQLAGVKATPELQSLVSELAREGSKGVIEGVTADETRQQVERLVAEVVRAFFAELRAGFGGVGGTNLDRAVDGAARSAMRSASEEAGRSFGPALRAAIVDLLADPAVKKGIGEMSHEIGKEAVRGTKEALAEDDGRRSGESGLGALAKIATGQTPLSLVVALLVILVLVVPVTWLLRERAAARREREDAERRSALALELLESAAREDDDPRFQKLLRHVASQLGTPDAGDGTRVRPHRRPRHA